MVSPRRGKAEASAIIWNRDEDEGIAPSAGSARIRGAVQAAVGAAIGAALFFFFDLRTLPYIMFTAASVILLASLLSPTGLFAALEQMLGAVAGRLGLAIMWISLGTIFYTFFMPFGAVFRRGRRDRLKRFLEADADSYWNWEPTEGPTSAAESLESQY